LLDVAILCDVYQGVYSVLVHDDIYVIKKGRT